MEPNFGSTWGSFIILWRNDSGPFAMTWITVCIHEKTQQEITPFAMFLSRDTTIVPASHNSIAQTRLSASRQQREVHDVNIDESFFRMPKCARQSADNFETELIPKMDRSRVRGDHEIELHAVKTHSTRLAQTVFGHSPSHSGTLGVPCDHESGVGDV